jgi:hypothetical protein
MAGTVKTDAVYKVKCDCGSETAVEVKSFGQPLRCKACSGSYKVIWGLDSKTKKKIPVTVDPSGVSKSHLKIPAGAQELVCPCGQNLLARPRQVGKKVQCPVCRAWMKLEHYKDPQTLETRIRRVDSRPRRDPSSTTSARDTTLSRVDPAKGMQDILCTCGESLRVRPEHLGKQAQCPACGTLMRLEKRRDPETSLTIVNPKIVGQAKPPPGRRGLDEDLSLDDFN